MTEDQRPARENETAEESSPAILWLDEGVLVFLLIFSIIGVAATHYSPAEAYLYWIAMIPIFGIGSMISAWAQATYHGHVRGQLLRDIIKVQLLHWGGTLLTVIGAAIINYYGHLTGEDAALVILLILGLATFLDGIRIGWRYSIAGVFLGMTSVIMAATEYSLPIVTLFAIALIIFTIYCGKRERQQLPS